MNLMILFESDFITEKRVKVSGRRYRHAVDVLRVSLGDVLRVGLVNGQIGDGVVVVHCPEDGAIELEILLHRDPPPSSLTLILAMPRPLMFKRILMHAVTLGVKRIFIIGSARVEKSYFHTPLLRESAIRDMLVEALEQAIDTRLPQVEICPYFGSFFEKEGDFFDRAGMKLLAHPYAKRGLDACIRGQGEIVLAIGPEGGFIPDEVGRFEAAGFLAFNMGPRILRVETAVCAALAQLNLL